MRAVIFDQAGDESELRVASVQSPDADPSSVRIRVTGAGVNRADLLQRMGHYPPPPGASEILGLECAGEVIETGSMVSEFQPGDRVMALLSGGGYAEEVVVPAGCVMTVPDRLTDIEAGGVPEVFLTAFLNLFTIGDLKGEETALIHGGSGGIGTAAIQLVKRSGCRALVTAGSPERCRRCLDLGADAAFDYRQSDFVEATRSATDGRGVDVVLDCIGGSYLAKNLKVLTLNGRLVIIGLQGGSRAEIDLGLLLRRRITVSGSTLRARPVTEKAAIIRGFAERFGHDLEKGAIRPIIDRSLPFDRAAEAHQLLAGGKIFGKLVLTPV